MPRFATSLLCLVAPVFATCAAIPAQAAAGTQVRPSQLAPDFIKALDQVASNQSALIYTPGVQQWVDAFNRHGVQPEFLARRLEKARRQRSDPFMKYRRISVEFLPAIPAPLEYALSDAYALHAYKFDVEEDYDDATNDDIYCYFITTHDDQVWGKATSIYRGMDEGTSLFFTAADRGLFGPRGEKLKPINHTIIDFGVIESDGADISQLKALSDAIVELAVKALDIYNPQAGAAAEQARAEVKNLLHMVIEMDGDDRLVTDSLYFTPQSMASLLPGEQTFTELDRFYDRETALTHFAYRLHFRLVR